MNSPPRRRRGAGGARGGGCSPEAAGRGSEEKGVVSYIYLAGEECAG